MGLMISGWKSDRRYSAGYSALHEIRAMAVAVARGITQNEAFSFLMDRNHENDPLWSTSYYKWLEKQDLLQFRQLLHFSDSEGIMIKSWYLNKIDTRNSMRIGDLEKLYEELEMVREAVTTDPEKYKVSDGVMRMFWKLYNLVKDESENGYAIVFH